MATMPLWLVVSFAASGATGTEVSAQAPAAQTLRELLERLERENPELARARHSGEAARERVAPAGALPDPMVTAGLMNLPVGTVDLSREGMSMAVLEIGQRFPAPGVRDARTRAAEARWRELEHRREERALELRFDVAQAYAELLFLDDALGTLDRSRELLRELGEMTLSRLSVGSAGQAEVVRTQAELTRLDERASDLRGARARTEASLRALLDSALAPGFGVRRPEAWERLLAMAPASGAFAPTLPTSDTVGGIPSLEELRERATREHPSVLAATEVVGAASADSRLAEQERRPDVSVMLGYGHRAGMDNLWSVSMSVGVPLFRGRKQEPLARAAGMDLEGARDDARKASAEVDAQVLAAWSDLLRSRERFHLTDRLLLPQATATVEAAMAGFRAGSEGASFLPVLDALLTLLAAELEGARAARDLSVAAARLEAAVGLTLFPDPDP
jgi:outer membrane protein, heavy metal efflux system